MLSALFFYLNDAKLYYSGFGFRLFRLFYFYNNFTSLMKRLDFIILIALFYIQMILSSCSR